MTKIITKTHLHINSLTVVGVFCSFTNDFTIFHPLQDDKSQALGPAGGPTG